jgi:(2Fe-2S) ferredoxin
MTYYQKHLFFCINQRESDKKCCANADSEAMCHYAKKKIKQLDLAEVRVNRAGCLGRCVEGPILVVYPEGIWYTYSSQADIDEIIEQHVLQNKIVSRLLLSDKM